MKLQILVALILAACHVQAISPVFVDLERRFGAKPAAKKAPKNETAKVTLTPPELYAYDTVDTDSDILKLRWAAPYIWSGSFEFGQLKRISKSGKKSHNILKQGVQKCLTVKDKETNGAGITVDACECMTGPCDKDNNINTPTPRFQWNIRGRVLYPAIYESSFLDTSKAKGKYDEKQLPFWYGWIQSALSEKCLTYVPPKTNPPPFTEKGTYGKIGDIVIKECTNDPDDFSQLWMIWVSRKDTPTRILPIHYTHRWKTCIAKGSNKGRHFRGLAFNTDPESEEVVYFGCHDDDHTAMTPHPGHFRVSDTDFTDIPDKDLDKFAKEHLVDFA
ncbi:hypothetical protein TWF718_008120 [Orbilia javanica]|uniref:Secreted protein n=1 Tax=Orbilia javanica TaxID=47235 RepID=A0AAN8RH23_9PEZI